MNAVDEKHCRVNGKRIFYRESIANIGSNPRVVLIHGNTASSLWFERAMEVGNGRLVAPDLPNFGASERIDSSEIDDYAEYAAGFIDEVLGAEPFVLVGHSLGGAVAMVLAGELQRQVRGLMLVDSCPPDGLVTPEEYYPVIEQYKTDRALLKQALAAVTPRLSDDEALESLVEEALRMNPASFAGNARALARFDFTPYAATVTIPVLVVRGTEDVLITAEMAERTAKAFPGGRIETIADVGHSLPVEDPPAFEALVSRFANQV